MILTIFVAFFVLSSAFGWPVLAALRLNSALRTLDLSCNRFGALAAPDRSAR